MIALTFTQNDIDELPYDQISMELQKGWKQARDKEIKLRYGYQLVRFAHYNRNYEEAIELSDDDFVIVDVDESDIVAVDILPDIEKD